MADRDACERALAQLAAALCALDPAVRRRRIPERRVALYVPDLPAVWAGRLGADGLIVRPAAESELGRAQVRFTARSDEVVAIGARPAAFVGAWLHGRVKVSARPRDLWELRRLL